MRQTYFTSLLTAVILFFAIVPAKAQWVDQQLPVTEHISHFHSIHEQCGIEHILQDPISLKALEEYYALRKLQPEGALVKSNISNSQVGDVRDFRVRNITNNQWRTVSFKLQARNNKLLIWVEEAEIAPDRVNDEVVNNLFVAMTQQTPELSINPGLGILEINQTVFGSQPNIDGSNTLNILITDVIDGWEPGKSTIAGFFDPVDLNPANSNSNRADIIYLNSRPIIHLDGNVNTTRTIPVAAHEYQHLIHANYGNLTTFQNEGQSEWAELLNGFSGRSPAYLANPPEIDQYLYRWRGGDQEVLFDYQRAMMLHTYIAERIGTTNTGIITRATSGLASAYNQALSTQGLNFNDVLFDFHVANFVNNTQLQDGRFGYTDIRRRNTRVSFATFTFFPGQTIGSGSRSLKYGGADYIEWIGAGNLSLDLNGSSGVRFAIITYPIDFSGVPDVQFVSSGSHQINGEFERVILLASATSITSGSEISPPDFTYTFDSSWDTLPIVIQNLSHFGPAAFFAELPGTPGLTGREGIREYAKRFSPQNDSQIKEIFFNVNGRDSSLIGNDQLRIVLAEGLNTGNQVIPGTRLDSLEISVSNLVRGENRISLEGMNWALNGGQSYFIIFRVTANTSRVEFLLDAGSEQSSNPNYFPVRSFAYIVPPTRPTPGWFSYQNRNNLHAGIRIASNYSGPITAPLINTHPVGGPVGIGQDFTMMVQATGVPAPIYQWYKDGEPVYGANLDRYSIEEMTEEDAGEYTVLVANPGGFILSEPAVLVTQFEDFALENNFPNPFSDRTTFEFVIPINASISIDIFDINGRLVDRVVNQVPFQAGRHQIEYPKSGSVRLASGVYLYRIQGKSDQNTFLETGKMLIIK